MLIYPHRTARFRSLMLKFFARCVMLMSRNKLKVCLALVVLICGFIAGVFYERLERAEVQNHAGKNDVAIIERLRQELQQTKAKNGELNETLQLVKRQIQVDRIAYEALRVTVEGSEQDRSNLREKLEQQRELLKSLRKRLDEINE